MRTFKDKAGREWGIEMDYIGMRRVREALGIPMARNGEWWQQSATDPETLVNVLYILCKPQCDAAGVGDVEFGRSIADVAAYTDATRALILATIDAAPANLRPRMEALYRKVMLDTAAESPSPN